MKRETNNSSNTIVEVWCYNRMKKYQKSFTYKTMGVCLIHISDFFGRQLSDVRPRPAGQMLTSSFNASFTRHEFYLIHCELKKNCRYYYLGLYFAREGAKYRPTGACNQHLYSNSPIYMCENVHCPDVKNVRNQNQNAIFDLCDHVKCTT